MEAIYYVVGKCCCFEALCFGQGVAVQVTNVKGCEMRWYSMGILGWCPY
jgi:hypothetical protein